MAANKIPTPLRRRPFERVCVFCGSSVGANRAYAGAARTFGRLLAREKLTLVYGGGTIGLMGMIASAVMRYGGSVIGVIPQALARREVAKTDITDLRIVGTMHERKAMMAELSDAFVALPGGMGTLEEFSEMVTWAQLGIHRKPCGLLNVAGYYDDIIGFFDHAVTERFLKPEYRSLILIDDNPRRMIELLRSYRPPLHIEKWAARRVD